MRIHELKTLFVVLKRYCRTIFKDKSDELIIKIEERDYSMNLGYFLSLKDSSGFSICYTLHYHQYTKISFLRIDIGYDDTFSNYTVIKLDKNKILDIFKIINITHLYIDFIKDNPPLLDSIFERYGK